MTQSAGRQTQTPMHGWGMSTLPHCAHHQPVTVAGEAQVRAGPVASSIAQRATGAVAQPQKGVARVAGLRVGERANGGSQPRGTDLGRVGGAEQLVVVDGADQQQLVLRAIAVAAAPAAHRTAPNAGQNGDSVRKRAGRGHGCGALGHLVTVELITASEVTTRLVDARARPSSGRGSPGRVP